MATLKQRENSTGVITCTLTNEDGVAVAGTSISSFKATLSRMDSGTPVIINSRYEVDLYQSGAWAHVTGMQAMVSAAGLCTIRLAAADNAVLSTATSAEWHALIVEVGTSDSPATNIQQQINFDVELNTKPAAP